MENKVDNEINEDVKVQTVNMIPNVRFINRTPKRVTDFIRQSDVIFAASIIYAVLYTFCMYKNSHGITAILWTGITAAYMYFCLDRLGAMADEKKKKSFAIYTIAELLIGINLCMTTDGVLIFLDHVAIVLLVTSCLLHMSCDDSKWGIVKYFREIVNIVPMAMFYYGYFFFVDLKDKKNLEPGDAKKFKYGKHIVYAFVGALIALPIVLVVVLLLASADKFFAQMVSKLFEFKSYDFVGETVGILVMIVFSFATGYGMLRNASIREDGIEAEKAKASSIIGITINVLIGIVYFAFSFIQIYYLFLGNLTIAEGYTYAEYAREGFFQLVVVCAINMIIVLVCLSVFENTKGLKAVLTFICACTYIMIASSALRMFMYVSVYNFTYTRVFVFLTLFIIFMIMNGIVVYIFKNNFKLFRYSMVVVAVCYMLFAYSKPCYWIASVNMSELYSNTEDIDLEYITRHLGTDAAPALQEYGRRFGHGRQGEIDEYFERYSKDLGIRTFNFSQARYESIANNR